jgi:predicted phosphodiesterase
MAAPSGISAASTAATSPSSAPSASALARVHGYPALLPGSVVTPVKTDPFWYDDYSPTELWNRHLSQVTKHAVVQPMQYVPGASLSPKPAGHLRFLCISDTHNFHDRLSLPPSEVGVDVLLHGGDFSNVGEKADVDAFTKWIRALPIKYKVMIAGNHDVSFDEGEYGKALARKFQHRIVLDPKQIKRDLTEGYKHEEATPENPFPAFAADGGVAYLEDSGISIEGIRIWGSPWQPEFFDCQFAVAERISTRDWMTLCC